MNKTVKTVAIKGGIQYAKVADRLKVFWEENPNGKIDSEREDLANGKIRFIARIWRDGAKVLELAKAGTNIDVISMTANATASAVAVKKGDKENAKLETVAVGRALAMLGYLASGEVASREEMEEFDEYKKEKAEEAVRDVLESLEQAKTIDELKEEFDSRPRELWTNEEVIAKKDEVKNRLLAKPKENTDES